MQLLTISEFMKNKIEIIEKQCQTGGEVMLNSDIHHNIIIQIFRFGFL